LEREREREEKKCNAKESKAGPKKMIYEKVKAKGKGMTVTH